MRVRDDMLSENIKLLNQYSNQTLTELKAYEKDRKETFSKILQTKSGHKTIQIMENKSLQLLHSKYDPQKEAEKFISQFHDLADQYEHVLFYGIGFGYHIKEFMTRFPNYTFSIYEPEIEVFYQFMNHCRLGDIPLGRLNSVAIETSREKGKLFLDLFIQNLQERVLVVTLPSYERVFKNKFQFFTEDFKAAMQAKRTNHYVDQMFSARWTLNSLLNFPKTFTTPNILSNEFKKHFNNKPLIIVSAGPSLEEEYDNLRYIKDKKLAYIFAVGSANRALIAQGILPDAVCTYDPQGHNYDVFASMIEQGITSVPMIYGTSVGFETLDMYKGPKLHMITNQDTIAQYYLKNKDDSDFDVVFDSSTIAAVTFQLAAKLGCNPIVFAGQNLAFRNNQFYSKDVDYQEKNRSIQVEEEDKVHTLLVEDVYGNLIETTPSFNNMRENIEEYIKQFPNVQVFNTTKGGAAIEGAAFEKLENIIQEKFHTPIVVNDWFNNSYNLYANEYADDKIKKMEHSIEKFWTLHNEITTKLAELQKSIDSNKEIKVSNHIMQFDKLMKKLIRTDCYQVYIQPTIRMQFQALSIRSANIRKQTSEGEKARLIIECFSPYLELCKQTLVQLVGSIYRIHGMTDKYLHPTTDKFYPCDCGVFYYEGNWEQQNYSPSKTIDFPIKQFVPTENAILRFRFRGTQFKVLGSQNKGNSTKIKLTIDGHHEIILLKKSNTNAEISNINRVLFEKNRLENKEHLVEMEILDGNCFKFTGIDINQVSRLFHIHEVTTVEQLEVGKRIRCHYKATYNKVGEFSGMGEETDKFIPIGSTAYPDGDFYFIMVDSDKEGKKLISDRNIQHSISWDTLLLEGIASGIGNSIVIDNYKGRCRLIYGGYYSYIKTKNEWDNYIGLDYIDSYRKGINWNCDGNISSWVQEGNFCYINKKNLLVTIRGEHKYVSSVNGKLEGSSFYHFSDTKNIVSHLGYRPLIILSK
ncbi:DUF115 domain-containing protein [Cytobacillus firmus]|uniref:motility associated factor glycosyltransferase family protein n=1 Tax=Cytobacillus firmus TaxID=1399 RepID=UPI0021852A87|nr:6-hydroxymethylpterin diphosphokinase MptE-like protein [Cytobacillus firmus]URM33459.1 DUF115 domain-containing protein [Cytobacillus firmus]